MSTGQQRPGELIQGINMTPLVDVVLVLLIIVMVSASHAVSRALPMDLPKASSGEAHKSAPIAISIDASGALYLDGLALSKPELRERVRRHPAAEERSAVIAADGAVAHRSVVDVIDLLRGEGVTHFAINVAEEDRSP